MLFHTVVAVGFKHPDGPCVTEKGHSHAAPFVKPLTTTVPSLLCDDSVYSATFAFITPLLTEIEVIQDSDVRAPRFVKLVLVLYVPIVILLPPVDNIVSVETAIIPGS